ncbi:MAG: hypothetical protein ACK5L8_08275 [Marinicella pacifica]
MTLRIGTLKKIVSHDLYYALRSARGVLFLVFFAVFWLWIFTKFGHVDTGWLKSPDSSFILAWLFDAKTAQSLFTERHPGFSLYYLIAINTAPFFVLFAASDQTANDIGGQYLRFLLPRCLRSEIYLGRFIGAVLLVWMAYAVVTLLAMFWVVMFNNASLTNVFMDALWMIVCLAVYAVPFIAMMSLSSALVGSAALSALLGIGFYFIVTIIVSIMGFQSDQLADAVSYILPNTMKSELLLFEFGGLLKAVIVNGIYTAVYLYAGWMIFSRRDI